VITRQLDIATEVDTRHGIDAVQRETKTGRVAGKEDGNIEDKIVDAGADQLVGRGCVGRVDGVTRLMIQHMVQTTNAKHLKKNKRVNG